MWFFNSAEEAYLEHREPISTLKKVSCSKDSFQNFIQFWQGKNVLDVPLSNTGDFLSGIHVYFQKGG
jgi:hypothetical protein